MFVQPITEAYSTLMHRSINQTPPRNVFEKHPPGALLLQTNNAVPTDANGRLFPQSLRARLEARICTLHAKVDFNPKHSQQQYKQYHNRHLPDSPSYESGGEIFLDQNPLMETKDNDVHQLVPCSYKLLLLHSIGRLCIISFYSHTVTIDKNGIKNTIIKYCVVHALSMLCTGHAKKVTFWVQSIVMLLKRRHYIRLKLRKALQ